MAPFWGFSVLKLTPTKSNKTNVIKQCPEHLTLQGSPNSSGVQSDSLLSKWYFFHAKGFHVCDFTEYPVHPYLQIGSHRLEIHIPRSNLNFDVRKNPRSEVHSRLDVK